MSQSRIQEGKSYRERKRAEMGEEAWKASEARKRQERRQRAKQIQQAPKPTIKTPPLPIPKSFLRNVLIVKIYTSKLKLVKAKNKTIKKSTVESQFKKVENIHKKMRNTEMDNLDWLKDTKNVLDFISTHDKWKTPNSKNSQIQAIAGILQVLPKFEKEYKIYSDASISGRKKIVTEDDKNLLTEKESKNILPWAQIKKIKPTNNFEKALIGIYTLLPPRRVQDVNFLTLIQYENFKDAKNSLNYVVLKNKTPEYLVYQNYKTFKTYGKIKIKIPKKLSDILKEYISSANLKEGNPIFPTQKKNIS